MIVEIKRGDIFYINKGDTVGSEQQAGRPAIVVSNDKCNEHSPVIEVVFLTRKWKKPLPTHVQIMSTGMRSTALCEQITAVDVERIGDFKGHLTDEEMAQVDHALLVSVGLDQLPINRENELTMDAALAILALRYVQDYLTKPHEEAFQHG